MKIEIVNGQALPLESRPFRSLFTGGSGPLKTSIVITETLMWIGEKVNDLVDAKLVTVLNPISKGAAIAAPMCCFPDAVKFSTDAVRDAKELFKKRDWSTFKDFSHSMVNVVQRISEFVYGLMKLEIIGDAIQMVLFKGVKSGLQIVHNIYVIHDANESDRKLHQIENKEVRELKKMENSAKVIRAIVNFTYHSFVLLSILSVSIVTGKMLLSAGIVSLAAGVTAHYIECAREDLESQLDAKRVNKLITKAGGWQAAV